MPTDLTGLLSLEPDGRDALDWFIGTCLCEGGIWESPRTSDGVQGIDRVLERSPNSLRVRGRVYEIDQTLHAFWLELNRAGSGDRFAWSLYYDVAEASVRRSQNALDKHERAEDIAWRATLFGEATVEGDALTVVPNSTRSFVRDMPEPEPSKEKRTATASKYLSRCEGHALAIALRALAT